MQHVAMRLVLSWSMPSTCEPSHVDIFSSDARFCVLERGGLLHTHMRVRVRVRGFAAAWSFFVMFLVLVLTTGVTSDL